MGFPWSTLGLLFWGEKKCPVLIFGGKTVKEEVVSSGLGSLTPLASRMALTWWAHWLLWSEGPFSGGESRILSLFSWCILFPRVTPLAPHLWCQYGKRAFSDPPLSSSDLILIHKEYFFLWNSWTFEFHSGPKQLKRKKVQRPQTKVYVAPQNVSQSCRVSAMTRLPPWSPGKSSFSICLTWAPQWQWPHYPNYWGLGGLEIISLSQLIFIPWEFMHIAQSFAFRGHAFYMWEVIWESRMKQHKNN